MDGVEGKSVPYSILRQYQQDSLMTKETDSINPSTETLWWLCESQAASKSSFWAALLIRCLLCHVMLRYRHLLLARGKNRRRRKKEQICFDNHTKFICRVSSGERGWEKEREKEFTGAAQVMIYPIFSPIFDKHKQREQVWKQRAACHYQHTSHKLDCLTINKNNHKPEQTLNGKSFRWQ